MLLALALFLVGSLLIYAGITGHKPTELLLGRKTKATGPPAAAR